MAESPREAPDPRLWFHHRGCSGRHYLLGNAHAQPGRMLAWCPVKHEQVSVTLAELQHMPPSTRYWVAGFLNGAEPSPPPFDASPRARSAWVRLAERFVASGVWSGRGPARRFTFEAATARVRGRFLRLD